MSFSMESQGHNYNRMLVDAGHAKIKDFEDNEFEPESWWS
jgi:hypothetical protein